MDYLLISTPNLVTSTRIRTQLEAAGVRTAESSMGLEVYCGRCDWHALLESLATMLSPLEVQATRLAAIPASDDPSRLHHAIFRAKRLDQQLREIRESWLNRVLDDQGIAIHLQPLIQYPPGRLHGYECLMRGRGSDGSLIPPSRMFDAAAALDKLRLLDEHCRAAAFSAAGRARAQARPRNISFFINFAPSAIADPRKCLHAMLRKMGEAGLRPQNVVFEVVETDKVHDQRHLMNIMRAFRKMGFKIALDDVGAGYASLLALSYLRPDYIKLEGELVRLAARSSLEAKIVADLAETARQNGIITVAEGIETAQELRMALRSGIRITQGYFHAKPQQDALSEPEIRAIVDRMHSAAACEKPAR